MEIKKCDRCKNKKHLTEFSKNRAKPSGYNGTCKKCEAKRVANYRKTKYRTYISLRRKWASENRDHINNTKRVWMETEGTRERCREVASLSRARRRETIRKQQREYYKNNIERYKEHYKKYYEKNKSTFIALSAKRKANKKKRTPSWMTPDDYANIRKFYTQREKRTASSGEEWHVDHIVPLFGVDENGKRNVSGLHVPWNLRVIKATTNLQKHNNFYDKWIHSCVRTT